MTTLTTLECAFALPRRQGRGTKNLIPVAPPETRAAERVPRIARLMALALRFEDLVRTGKIHSYAELARLGHVTRARMTQIMNLRLLAADIQEEILFLPTARCGRDL